MMQYRRKLNKDKKKEKFKINWQFSKTTIVFLSLITLFVLIGCVVAACYFAGYLDVNDNEGEVEEEEEVATTALLNLTEPPVLLEERRRRLLLLGDSETRQLPLHDAMNFCAMRGNKRLPIPMDEIEEQQLMEQIKLFHNQSQCEAYILGYKLNRFIRYRSLDGQKSWPALKDSVIASIVANDRDCVRVQLTAPGQNFAIVDHKPCKDIVDYHCVIGYKINQSECKQGVGELCFNAIYAYGYNPEDMFKNYRKSVTRFGREENGLLLIDRGKLAVSYTAAVYSLPKICWALDVKYELEYLDVYDSGPSPYNISVIIQDPEQECLVITQEFQIETKDCGEGGCPLCAIRGHL